MTPTRGTVTHREILLQPELWPTTLARTQDAAPGWLSESRSVVIAGAGSSAHAATAIAAAWPGARAIPTTDLLLDARSSLPPDFAAGGLLISLARSGDSPESVGTVDLVARLFPAVRHVAITCNPDGRLAGIPGVHAILLDPRTNDRSLAVTSSFTNTVLAGLCLRHADRVAQALPGVCDRVRAALPELDAAARAVAETPVSRVTVLSPPALAGAAREAALKILEMSDGQIVAMPDTFLGVRHGPMTYLHDDGLVLCLLSTDPIHRRYEEDLLEELRNKHLGRIIVVAPVAVAASLCDLFVEASAPDLVDSLRTPFEMVFPQLLAYHLSLRLGLDPDESSPRGVINRVVQGVRIHGV